MSIAYAQKQTTAQKKNAPSASSVLDASSQNESLQRKADLVNGTVQRVVQRVGEANGTFKYFHNISGHRYKDRVPYEPEKISFTPYTGGEVKSADFTGCFMMVFRFVDNNQDRMNYRLLMCDESRFFSPIFNTPYIAHVATGQSGDAKLALFDAESRGLIEIVAMFKPYRNTNDDDYSSNGLIRRKQNVLSAGGSRVRGVTGGMYKDEDGNWCAKVYSQEQVLKEGWKRPFMDLSFDKIPKENFEKIPSDCTKIENIPDEFFDSVLAANLISQKPEFGKWENTERENRRMDAERLKFETEATKAFWYASVAVSTEGDAKENAYKKLKKMSPMALQYAIGYLSSNKDANTLMESLLESPSASECVSSESDTDRAMVL